MTTFSKIVLSGSTNGVPILVAGTAIDAATTIHTSHATSLDEVWLWVTNTDSSARTISITCGGNTDPDNLVIDALSLPAGQSMLLLVPGLSTTNSKVWAAFASVTNVITITGYVNRIT